MGKRHWSDVLYPCQDWRTCFSPFSSISAHRGSQVFTTSTFSVSIHVSPPSVPFEWPCTSLAGITVSRGACRAWSQRGAPCSTRSGPGLKSQSFLVSVSSVNLQF